MSLWDAYLGIATHDAELVASALPDADTARALAAEVHAGHAHVMFRLGMSSLLIGAEDVARLALALERALDVIDADDGDAWGTICASAATLRGAIAQLANPDKSGARVEGLPLVPRREALEAFVADKGDAARSAAAGGTAVAAGAIDLAAPPQAHATAVQAAPGGAFVWVPTVDDDMVDLFFDEATERVEALAGKLIEIERQPGNQDVLRDVFRDMHTVKGSSAMVGLSPINQLAHAAEDLVGQIRDAGRAVDESVIDALLAALDGLRDMLAQARARQPITYDPTPVVMRLRNPSAPTAHRSQPAAGQATGPAAPSIAAAVHAAAVEAKQTIRVDFDKLDRLLNLVGELVLGREELRNAVVALASVTSELAADRGVARRVAHARGASGNALIRGLDGLGEEIGRIERVLDDVGDDLDHGTDKLDAISDELRDQVMKLRMVPVGGVFRKHVRTVRDLAASLNKRARLELDGDDTELDKLLVESLDEPLMHLVRNAVDHGIELPDVRTGAGKAAEGVIRLSAAHRGNQVEIRISDDGKGLDAAKLKARAIEKAVITEAEAAGMDERAAFELIFRAGFSTAATVSEISGRGVGMDVVRQTIVNRLKGTIDIESTLGQGSALVLKLPLTLAIIQVLVARVGGETFAIPLDTVLRVLGATRADIALIGDREVVVVRGKHVPLIRLDQVLELDVVGTSDDLQLVLTEQGGTTYALACDHLVGKREIVIKSLGKLLGHVPCAAGATLLGDRVALILDVPAIVKKALASPSASAPRTSAVGSAPRVSTAVASTQILLVEDSDIVRESLRRLLVDAGYQVTTASDGQHGLEISKTRKFDLVSTDVVMPRMDGYELTRALRGSPDYATTPIVMVTSKGERIDRVRGFDAGVDEYITKPHDRKLLLAAVRKLLGHGKGDGDHVGPSSTPDEGS